MKENFYVALDHIRSVYNVGSIFRTADAFGVSKLYLCGITPTPPRSDLEKTALGAEKTVPWEYKNNIVDLIKELKEKGVQIISLEKTPQSIKILEAKFQFPLCLMLGNEVSGVSKEVLELSDMILYIPMYGKKESLNVSVAFGIAAHIVANDHDRN